MDALKEKPMDIFGEKWIMHEEKIFDNWKQKVTQEDLVLIPGDISWAMRLETAKHDLAILDSLPGKKVISKGNHDFWWESVTKMNKLGLQSLYFLNNNAHCFEGIGVTGSRGWTDKDNEDFDLHDDKIYDREVGRLRLSLEALPKEAEFKIAMIHYPPFKYNGDLNEFGHLMVEYKVDICVYGHLHGEGHQYVVEGLKSGVEFICVSSDYIDFDLKFIKEI